MKKPSKTTPRKLDFGKVARDIEALWATANEGIPLDWEERIFLDSDCGDCGLRWVLPDVWKIEKQMQNDDPEAAITNAFLVIRKLMMQVSVLAKAIPALKKRVAHSVGVTETGLRNARAEKEEKTQARHNEIRKAVQAKLDENKKNSLTYAREQVAENGIDRRCRKISLTTVKKATKGMKGNRTK